MNRSKSLVVSALKLPQRPAAGRAVRPDCAGHEGGPAARSVVHGQPRLLPARMAANQGAGPAGPMIRAGRARLPAGCQAAAARCARSPRRRPAGRTADGRRRARLQEPLVWPGRFAELADERRVQMDRAPRLTGQRGQFQPHARIRVDPKDDLVGARPGWQWKEGEPGSAAPEQPHLGDVIRQRGPSCSSLWAAAAPAPPIARHSDPRGHWPVR